MKNSFFTSLFFLSVTALLLSMSVAQARDVYGVSGRRGRAVVGENRAVVSTRRGVVATGPNGTVAARRHYVAPLPRGYIRTVPVGYRRSYYSGYSCMYVGGIYYRPIIYGGETVYIIVH